VNITQRVDSSELPVLVVPFIAAVRRVIPGKLVEFQREMSAPLAREKKATRPDWIPQDAGIECTGSQLTNAVSLSAD